MNREGRLWADWDYEQIGMLGNWHLLRDITEAIQFGYASNYMLMPGTKVDIKEARARVAKIQDEWCKEASKRDQEDRYARSPDFNSLSDEVKCYLNIMLKRGRSVPSNSPDIEMDYL